MVQRAWGDDPDDLAPLNRAQLKPYRGRKFPGRSLIGHLSDCVLIFKTRDMFTP